MREDVVSSQASTTATKRGRRHGLFVCTVVMLGLVGASRAALALPAPVPAGGTPPPVATNPVDEQKEKAQEARLEAAEDAVARQSAELAALKAEMASERAGRQDAGQQALAKVDQRLSELPPTLKLAKPGYGLAGFLQVDSPFRQSSESQINGSTGDLLNQNRIYLRRARLRFYLDRRYGAGAVELDANSVNGPTARVVGAEASLKLPGPDDGPPLLMLSGGLLKTPFGYEIGQSDRDRLFMERSTAEQALFPGEYDGAVRLSGGWRFLRYAVAMVNGEPIGERSYPGRDPNKWKDVVGRFGLDASVLDTVTVWAGVSALYGHGFHRGTTATKDVVQWRDLNDNRTVEASELTVIPGSPPTPSFSFDRNAAGADLGLKINWAGLGETALYGELYLAQNLDRGVLPYDPSSPDAPKARELGWYVAATQQLTSWAMLGVRYDVYDPDRDASETRVGRVFSRPRDFNTLAVAGAFTTPYGRLVVEYDRNRNHLGRDLQGRTTNLKDDAVIVRGQVNF